MPPANDSQAQQSQLMKKHGMTDAVIDWADLNHPIDYYSGKQPEIVRQIAAVIALLSSNPNEMTVFISMLKLAFFTVEARRYSQTSGLIDQFGMHGIEDVGKHLLFFAKTSRAHFTEEVNSAGLTYNV